MSAVYLAQMPPGSVGSVTSCVPSQGITGQAKNQEALTSTLSDPSPALVPRKRHFFPAAQLAG